MDFKTYFESKKAKNPKTTEKEARSWWKRTAAYSAQFKDEDDFVEADQDDITAFHKSDAGRAHRYYQNGAIGVMEGYRLIGDLESFEDLRKQIIKPLKKDRLWDYNFGLRERPLIKAGEVPPPRYASQWSADVRGQVKQVTRRSCAAGLVGMGCDHPVGSSICNGGVAVIRRLGE